MTSLPLGTKSLREIDLLDDDADRLRHLGTLLEFEMRLLGSTKADGSRVSGLTALAFLHYAHFSDFEGLEAGIRSRNSVTHGGHATLAEVADGAEAIRLACTELLPHLADRDATVVRGGDVHREPTSESQGTAGVLACAVALLLVAVGLPVVQSIRESRARAETERSLRSLGPIPYNFGEVDRLPPLRQTSPAKATSVWKDLLPEVEQSNLTESLEFTPPDTAATP